MEKKKILLRLDPKLHTALKKWADDEFRSLNSHIEFLLKRPLERIDALTKMNKLNPITIFRIQIGYPLLANVS